MKKQYTKPILKSVSLDEECMISLSDPQVQSSDDNEAVESLVWDKAGTTKVSNTEEVW